MRKNIFIKQNGVLPETPFKKGDIVTYVDLDRSTQPHKVVSKEIMILDHIRAEKQCDIFAKVVLTIAEGEKPLLTNNPFSASRVWYNGDKVRYATWYEMKLLIHALTQTKDETYYQDVSL